MGLLAAPGRRPAAGAAPLCFVALICDYFHKLRGVATAGHAPGASPREGRLHAQSASLQQEAGQFMKTKNFNMLMKFEIQRAEKGGKPWGNREGRKSGGGVVEIVERQINQGVMPGKTKCASLRRKMGQNATPCTPAAGPHRSRAKPWEIATSVARFQRKCIPFPALAVWAAWAVVGGSGEKSGKPPQARGSAKTARHRVAARCSAPARGVGRMQAASGHGSRDASPRVRGGRDADLGAFPRVCGRGAVLAAWGWRFPARAGKARLYNLFRIFHSALPRARGQGPRRS